MFQLLAPGSRGLVFLCNRDEADSKDRKSAYLDVLLCSSHDALPHEQAVIFKELGIFFRIFFTLVKEELDQSLL